MSWIISFLSLYSFIFANFENDASIAINRCINPISGDYIVSECDLVAKGYEPISLERIYLSSMQENAQPQWMILPHLFIYFEPNRDIKTKPSQIYATEPHGTKIHYQNSLNNKTTYLPYFDEKSKGITNSSTSAIGAATNLRNYKLLKLSEDNSYLLITPDGTQRFYKKLQQMYFAFLEKERKPNGNWIIYQYHEDFYTLKQIYSTNPSQSVIYATISFKHQHRDPSVGRNFTATTSTGDSVSYTYDMIENNEERFFKLKSIKKSTEPEESLEYQVLDKRRCELITERRVDKKIHTKISYYHPKTNQVGQDTVTILDTCDPIEKRIKTLEEPVGRHGALAVTHRLFYNLGQHPKEKKRIDFSKLKQPSSYAVDYDVYNNKTVYYFNEYFVPLYTHKYGSDDTAIYKEYFFWKQDNYLNLLDTKIIASSNAALAKTKYCYDQAGNVVQKTLTGNLTGHHLAPISLDNTSEDAGADHLVTTYAFDTSPYRNLTRKATPEGLSYLYQYLPNTHLKTAELTLNQGHIELRSFFKYSADNVLIETIEDDGSSIDSSDMTRVTYRKVTSYVLSQHLSSYNFPEVIEEKGWNPKTGCLERLIKKVIVYNSKGLIEKETAFDAQDAVLSDQTYLYDAKNRCIEIVDSLKSSSHFTYNPLNQLVSKKEKNKLETVSYEKDFFDNPLVIHTSYPGLNSEKEELEYDLKQRIIYAKDALNNVTNTTYDDFDRPTATWLPLRLNTFKDSYRPKVLTSYDCFGNLIRLQDELGFVTETTYNLYNQPITITYPDGTKDSFLYSVSGSLLKETSRSGISTYYTYDFLKRVTKKESFSKSGLLLSSVAYLYKGALLLKQTDHHNTKTSYRYDSFCRKISETVTRNDVVLSCNEFSYDAFGRLESITRRSCNQDNLSSCKRTHYDSRGNITKEQELDGSTVVSEKKYVYDIYDRLITILTSGETASQESFSYDSKSRLVSYTNQEGHIITKSYKDGVYNPQTFSYDCEVTTTYPSLSYMQENYNSLGELSAAFFYDPQGHLLKSKEFFYDAKGQLVKQTERSYDRGIPSATVTCEKRYDFWGNVIEVVQSQDEEKKCSSFIYDEYQHLVRQIRANGVTVEYNYDTSLHLASIQSSDNTVHYTFEYDAFDRCIQESDHIHNTQILRSFNSSDLIKKESFLNGLSINYSYDGFGRATHLILPDQSSIHYSYNGCKLKKISRKTAQQQEYFHTFDIYDARDHCLQETSSFCNQPLQHRFNLQGSKVATQSMWHQHSVENFFEDGSIQATCYKSPLEIIHQKYTYDALGHLTSESGYQDQYYVFDGFDSLREKNDALMIYASLFKPIEDAKAQYTYCPSGNRAAKQQSGKTLHYTYDALGRLTALSSDTIQIQCTYDSKGRRLSKRAFSKSFFGSWSLAYENFYVFSQMQELGAFSKTGNLQQLRILSDLSQEDPTCVAIELGKTIYLPLYDLWGNITELVDTQNERCVESYRYSAFGEITYLDRYGYRLKESYYGNPWQYQGKRCEEESGLIFFGLRYYDPRTICWITPDPLQDLDGVNPYHYIHGNPLDFKDVFGLLTTSSEEDVSSKLNPIFPFTPNDNPYSSQAAWVFTPQGYQYQSSETASKFKQGLYTPYSTYNIHPDKGFATSENYRFFFINGINTTLKEAKAMQASCSEALGFNVDLFYNSTHGTYRDIQKVRQLHFRQDVDLVKEFKRCVLHEISRGKEVVVFAHSAGGSILHNSFELLPESFQEKIHMISFGSAKYLPKKFNALVENYVSTRDRISSYSNSWHARATRHHPLTIKASEYTFPMIYMLPSYPSIIKEHSFMETSYQNALRSSCKKIRNFSNL